MKKYFIDTSVIISFLRGESKAVELLEKLEGELCSGYICLAELYEGIARAKQVKKAEKGVIDFFNGLSEVYSLDKETAKIFGQIRAELKQSGRVIEDLDIFLASICIAYDLILVTYNPNHFKRVKNLKILEIKQS